VFDILSVLRYPVKDGHLTVVTGGVSMQRMSRAGRVVQLKSRMLVEKKRTKKQYFTAGELSRMVGVKSSTWWKNFLMNCVREGELIRYDIPRQGFMHEVTVYELPAMKQVSLPERWIIINGKAVRMS